eukprot:gene47-2406_t
MRDTVRRLNDTEAWDEMRTLFTPGAESWYQSGRLSFSGADAIVAYLKKALPAGGAWEGHKFTVESYRGKDSPSAFLWPRGQPGGAARL